MATKKLLIVAVIVVSLIGSFGCNVVLDNSVRVLTPSGQGTEDGCPEGTHPENTPLGDICAEDE